MRLSGSDGARRTIGEPLDLHKGLHPITRRVQMQPAGWDKILDRKQQRLAAHGPQSRAHSREPPLDFTRVACFLARLYLVRFAARTAAAAQHRQHDQEEQADEDDDDADLQGEEQERDELDELAHQRNEQQNERDDRAPTTKHPEHRPYLLTADNSASSGPAPLRMITANRAEWRDASRAQNGKRARALRGTP